MEASPNIIRICKDFLKKKNPLDYRPKGSTSKWDGFYRFYNTANEFNIGLLPSLVKHLNEEEIDFEIIDQRGINKVSEEKIIFSENFLSDERDYQRKTIKQIIQNRYGIVIIPTRGGKTFTIAESMRIIWNLYKEKGKKEFKALFVVDTDDLFNQALKDFSRVLNLPVEEIGVIKEQTFIVKNINVASIQTIESIKRVRKKKTAQQRGRELKWGNFCKELDYLCVDEIQGFSNSNRLKILPKEVYFRIGVSATPWDNEFEAFKLLDWFGPLLVRVKESELKNKDVLVKNYVFLIEIDTVKNSKRLKGSGYRREYDKKVVFNDDRNLVLAAIVKSLRSIGFKILVLSTRVYHGELFYNLFQIKKNVSFISGEHSSEIRKEETEKFLSAKGGYVLIATDIYKKGITLPQADIFVNLAGMKKESLTIQKRGRVLGSSEDKFFALIFDVLDTTGGNIEKHADLRYETYKKLKDKKSVDDIFKFQANDFDLISNIKRKIDELSNNSKA
jgi:superfamily II DNA or RNA helicase